MNRLDRAIRDFEDENSELSLGERISAIREALMWNAHEAMKRINQFGKKDPISEEEDYKQTECMRWFKELEKLYNSQIKMNKILGKKENSIDQDFIHKIKGMKGSIGEIVREIQPSKN